MEVITMSERKQRTPAEIIAETEAKLSRLRVKQAKQDAMSNPAVAPLVEELDALRKDIREAKKGLGDGPQSFNARVAKHDAWIEKIEAERLEAEATLSSAEQRKTEIEMEMATVINGLVSDGPSELSAEA
jgi:capsule polysaccharide export protein KpsE/RkpR